MIDCKKMIASLAAIAFMVFGFSTSADAQDFVYQFTNPAFGGSPYNYSWMMNSANSQNKFQQSGGGFSRDPLANFEESLQRQGLCACAHNSNSDFHQSGVRMNLRQVSTRLGNRDFEEGMVPAERFELPTY